MNEGEFVQWISGVSMRASGAEQDMSSQASICAFQPLSHEATVVHEPAGHFVHPSLQHGRAVTIGEAIRSGTGGQGNAHKKPQLAFEITESRSCSRRKSNLCSTGETARSSFRIPLIHLGHTAHCPLPYGLLVVQCDHVCQKDLQNGSKASLGHKT